VQGLRESQFAVWTILCAKSVTDVELVHWYESLRSQHPKIYPRQSESGLRTRRRELVDMGLVVDTGRTETLPSGRKAIVWGVPAPEGQMTLI
jgi:hypothetical protein